MLPDDAPAFIDSITAEVLAIGLVGLKVSYEGFTAIRCVFARTSGDGVSSSIGSSGNLARPADFDFTGLLGIGVVWGGACIGHFNFVLERYGECG